MDSEATLTPLERLQQLLRDLLQLDLVDLDFGIYRLLRLKHDEVTAFLEEQLPGAVDAAFEAVSDEERARIDEEVETLGDRVRDDIAPDALAADGSISPEYRDVKAKAIRELVDEYESARARLGAVETTDEQRAEVFNHLYAFFRRYYEDGDFIPKRRRSAREHYVIPYNGEETLLHWANHGQHYVKNAEVFKDYAFSVEGDLVSEPFRVRFVLSDADLPPGDTKGDARYFFPLTDRVEWDGERRVLELPFHYRLPTEEEAADHGRTRVQETILQEALQSLLEAVPEADVRNALGTTDGDPAEADEEESPTLLFRHLRRFTRRNTSDYFVHRDLAGFLERELEFYIKDQIVNLGDLDSDVNARQRMLRVFRSLAGQLITFLAQIEEVQKRLFEKLKFVLRTDYLVLIEAVSRDLWDEVLANDEQLAEWQHLFHIDPETDLLNPEGEVNESFLERNPTLVVDTSLFPDEFRTRVLESFDDIDAATGGILIRSENYQALRLLEARFRDQVKCIYIDPPYNTGSDDFLYKDRYQHSSWLSMMEERLRSGRHLLADDGAIFVSVDDNEQPNLRRLGDTVFGRNNFVDTVIWQKVYAPKSTARQFSASHDFVTVYAKSSKDWTPNLLPRSDEANARYTNRDDDPRGPWKPGDLSARNYYSKGEYEVTSPSGEVFSNPPGTYWRVSYEKFQEVDADNRIWWGEEGDNMPAIKRFLSEVKEGMVPQTLWPYEEVGHTQEAKKELMAILDFPRNEDVLQTVKPTRLIRRIVHLASDPGDWVMDFFAGSGTTGHAVLDHNRESEDGPRRFLLVEQGEYFDRMVVRRITRALFASEWKDHEPASDADAAGLLPIVKVLRLESYEDALHSLASADTDEKEAPRRDAVRNTLGDDEYRLRYLARLPLESSTSLLDLERLEHPFRYEFEVLTDAGPTTQNVDLVETFNLLYGLRVRKIRRWVNEDDGERSYLAVTGDDAEGQRVLVLWRDMEDLDAAVERAFLEARMEASEDAPFDLVLINGDSTVPGVRSLDPIFKARMEARET